MYLFKCVIFLNKFDTNASLGIGRLVHFLFYYTGLQVGLNERMLSIINSGNWYIIYSMFCYCYFYLQHVHVSHVHMAYVAFTNPPNSWDVVAGHYISYRPHVAVHICLALLFFLL